jgi:hypothetical protein
VIHRKRKIAIGPSYAFLHQHVGYKAQWARFPPAPLLVEATSVQLFQWNTTLQLGYKRCQLQDVPACWKRARLLQIRLLINNGSTRKRCCAACAGRLGNDVISGQNLADCFKARLQNCIPIKNAANPRMSTRSACPALRPLRAIPSLADLDR